MKFMQPILGWLRARTPRPPFDQQYYWDKVYRDTRGRVIEWAEMSVPELTMYKYGAVDDDFRTIWNKEGSLVEHVGKDDNIIVLGCGNSAMSDELRESGWAGKITSADFAEESVEYCKARAAAKGLKGMNFITADVRALHEHVPAASYDVALDKGCLDAIYNSKMSNESVLAVKASVLRVLKPGGRWVAIMNGGFMGLIPPLEVKPLIEDSRWKSVEVRRLSPMLSGIYMLVCTKETARASTPSNGKSGEQGKHKG